MSTYFEILDAVKPVLPVLPVTAIPVVPVIPVPDRQEARSLVIHQEGKTFLTVPVQESALNAEDFVLRIRGRMVGADKANKNGQYWTKDDLAFGLPSVATGPLNWLHEERRIIGCQSAARLVEARDSAGGSHDGLSHIEADSVVWTYLHPAESHVIRQAAADQKLYYSMECVSSTVECFGPTGCGTVMQYADAFPGSDRACAHVRNRTAIRRLANPVFTGAAVIVPPFNPGWPEATAGILKQAASLAEPVARFTQDEALAAQILTFMAGVKA